MYLFFHTFLFLLFRPPPPNVPHTRTHAHTSNTQLAVDFVSPESIHQALALKSRLRHADLTVPQPLGAPPQERQCQEKLQSLLILLRGTLRAARALKGSGVADGDGGADGL